MRVVTSSYGFLMTLLVHGCMSQVSIDTEPQNVAGILGSTQQVLLQCRMSTDDGLKPIAYTWAVDGREIFDGGDKQEGHELADYVELADTITEQWTNYDLVVKTTASKVAVRYLCSGFKGSLLENKAADVLLVESHPTCYRDKEVYIEGATATISCEVKYYGRWGPDITLTGPGQLVDNSGVNFVKWSRELKVDPDNNGETFTCNSEYSGPPNPGSDDATNIPDLPLNDCTETIVVQYAPRSTKIEQDSASVGETLTCVSDANPAVEESGFVWTVGEETSTGSTFELKDRHEGELNISCCASNIHGGPDCDEKISMPVCTTTTTITTTTTPDSNSEPSGPTESEDNTVLIVGVVITFLVILAIVAGNVIIFRRLRSYKYGRHQRENPNLHLPPMVAEREVGTSEDSNTVGYDSLMLRQSGVKTPPVYTSLSSTNQSNEPTDRRLERSSDEHQITTPIHADLGGPTEQMETEYEDVGVKSVECTAEAVDLETLLHSGTFCELYIGIVRELEGCSPGMRVVVKKNKDGTTALEQSMLVGEIKALQTVGRHPNIVQLLAQCVLTDPVMSVCALETSGDLRNYLQELQGHLYANTDLQNVFVRFALDVASGMAYLSGIKPDIIHRRLATKHVLIGERQVCKVIGFGFAEQILDREKYERTRGIDQEIRWMAPEQLTLKDHSQKSDVWAFGVLMWEAFSCGEEPYGGLSDHEVKQLILSGGALGMPQGTKEDIFDVMLKCWNKEEQKRPDFHSLREVLRSIRHRSVN